MKNEDFTMFVYCLLRDGSPFYVGITKDPEARLKSHWYKYVDEFEFDSFILDEVPYLESTAWEGFYINLLESWGFRLENAHTNTYSCFDRKDKEPTNIPEVVYGVQNASLKAKGAAYLRSIKNDKGRFWD